MEKAAEAGKQRGPTDAQARTYLELADLLLVALDLEARVLWMNRKGRALLQCEEGEVTGQDWLTRFVPKDEREAVREKLAKVRAGELDDSRVEHGVNTCKGERLLVSWRTTVIRDEAGGVVGTMSSGEDITEQRRVEEALRASEARLRLVSQQVPGVLWSVDNDLRITLAAGNGLERVGLDPEKLIGISMESLPFTQGSDAVPLVQCALRGEGSISVGEYRGRWYETRIDPLFDRLGNIVGAIGLAVDATERRRAEESTCQAKAEAERANAAKDAFLAVLSHEMRTPLGSIVLRTEKLLRQGTEWAAARRSLEGIRRSARDLAAFIDDLLDVSRIASGKVELKKQAVAIARIVTEGVETLRGSAEERGLRLEASISDAGVVEADSRRLLQVVTNLLTNALKFTPAGGLVQVELTREGDQALLRVRDTGAGIAAEDLPKLFSRFFQSPRTRTRTKGGLGLGLALVRHFVELHGGTVLAESPGEGLGASFTVRLPLAGTQAAFTEPSEPVVH